MSHGQRDHLSHTEGIIVGTHGNEQFSMGDEQLCLNFL